MSDNRRIRFMALSLFGLLPPLAAIAEPSTGRGNVEICATYDPTSPDDFQKEFSFGDITVPAGTVFDGPAHMFNGLKDPGDMQHIVTDPKNNDGKGWLSISDAEEKGERVHCEQTMKSAICIKRSSLMGQSRSANITFAIR
ncbi:hypothetical protein RI056_16120 [Komagataeibacter nataicola]|uniref:hypothetical protein n=1 Tax=Komagataeibacter nataicola TaxID=265960 RepID=UPI0028AC678C|nr:hypothetical protein [Komagataeibacter nataicola]WNM08363.1 hypothetical protein RI056_16120 [Komagataeibacter nataicola]